MSAMSVLVIQVWKTLGKNHVDDAVISKLPRAAVPRGKFLR
ncbi:MAG: hypothetical protein LUH51_02125 [Firmicutes bacterium]|nr:hypothetical protein [Bacillota bacterium]